MRQFLLCAALVALAAPAAAAPLEKKGNYDFTACFAGETFIMAPSQTMTVLHFRVNGTSRSNIANGAFDQNTFMCAGVTFVNSGVPSSTSYCEYLDGDGDKTFGRTVVNGMSSTWTFLSGTGKYQNIAGTGTVDVEGRFPLMRPGNIAGCTRNKGSWTLP